MVSVFMHISTRADLKLVDLVAGADLTTINKDEERERDSG
jgi:hypothetical protein